MDGSRFDDLTRTLAGSVSRRGALKLLLGGAVAGIRAAAGGGAAAQAARKPPGFERLGKPCDNGQPCGIHTQCALGTCKAIKCWIGEAVVARLATEQGNPCHICQPGKYWSRWSDVADGTTCPPGDSDNPCLSTFIGTCQTGECVAEPLADGTECGEGQTCCQGNCCATGLPCHPVTGCGGCDIGGTPYPAGVNLNNVCQVCDALANPSDWSPAPGNPPCGDDLDRVCCNGDCCPPGQCCSPAGLCEECCETGDGNRVDGQCVPGCTIDSVPYADLTSNPNNYCELCDAARDSTAWSPRANEAPCGRDDNRVCCNGVCCEPDTCCLADGTCGGEACVPEGCMIDGVPYAYGAPKPDNVCQICDPGNSTTAWSPVSIAMCGPSQDQFCSGGVCCDLGICPDLATNTCGDYCDAVCAIGGTLYYNGDRNPANGCEVCASHTDHTAWTLVAPNYYCDPDAQTGACCAGTCCNSGEFCNTNEGFVCDADSSS